MVHDTWYLQQQPVLPQDNVSGTEDVQRTINSYNLLKYVCIIFATIRTSLNVTRVPLSTPFCQPQSIANVSSCLLRFFFFSFFLVFSCLWFGSDRRRLTEELMKSIGMCIRCENCGAYSPKIRKDGSNKLFQVRVCVFSAVSSAVFSCFRVLRSYPLSQAHPNVWKNKSLET